MCYCTLPFLRSLALPLIFSTPRNPGHPNYYPEPPKQLLHDPNLISNPNRPVFQHTRASFTIFATFLSVEAILKRHECARARGDSRQDIRLVKTYYHTTVQPNTGFFDHNAPDTSRPNPPRSTISGELASCFSAALTNFEAIGHFTTDLIEAQQTKRDFPHWRRPRGRRGHSDPIWRSPKVDRAFARNLNIPWSPPTQRRRLH